jgi:hypothetical protein
MSLVVIHNFQIIVPQNFRRTTSIKYLTVYKINFSPRFQRGGRGKLQWRHSE